MNQHVDKDKDSPQCDLCGRSFKSYDELELLPRTGQYLCRDCMAEELSCGCGDD